MATEDIALQISSTKKLEPVGLQRKDGYEAVFGIMSQMRSYMPLFGSILKDVRHYSHIYYVSSVRGVLISLASPFFLTCHDQVPG